MLEVKKIELSGPFAKVGPPPADNDSSNPSENVHKKTVFLLKVLIQIYYRVIVNYLIIFF